MSIVPLGRVHVVDDVIMLAITFELSPLDVTLALKIAPLSRYSTILRTCCLLFFVGKEYRHNHHGTWLTYLNETWLAQVSSLDNWAISRQGNKAGGELCFSSKIDWLGARERLG